MRGGDNIIGEGGGGYYRWGGWVVRRGLVIVDDNSIER